MGKLEIDANERETLRQYLLGQIPETDLSRVEERLMTDSDSYQELLILEDEVVDQYVRHQMSGEDRESFENHFVLSPEHRQKVRFAGALSKYVNLSAAAQPSSSPANEDSLPRAVNGGATFQTGLNEAARETVQASEKLSAVKKDNFWSFWPIQEPNLNYALGAIVFLVLAGIPWMVVRSLRTPIGHGNVFAVSLAPGGPTRDGGGEIQTISIPAGTDTVRLQLLLARNEYQFYEAILLDSDGRTITTKNSLTAESANGSPAGFLEIAPNLLPPGDYRVNLNGLSTNGNSESAASYSFRITSR